MGIHREENKLCRTWEEIMGGKKEDSNIREKSVDYISLYFLISLRL